MMTMTKTETLSQEETLIIALQQISDLSTLLEGNEWETYLASKLINIECELSRQLNILQSSVN